MAFDSRKALDSARSIWASEGIDSADFVLLLPHAEAPLNAKLRSVFASKLGNRRGTVLEGQKANEVLALFSLYAFTDKLIVGSFDLPHGRKLRNLLDCGAATEDELINDTILGAMGGE
jgi:hypothetical protein